MCDHGNLQADIEVVRLDDNAKNFLAKIKMVCSDCGAAFEWVGDRGLSMDGPRVSLDGLTLRAPVTTNQAWRQA